MIPFTFHVLSGQGMDKALSEQGMEMMALKAGHPQLWPENLSSSAAVSTFPAKYGYACTHLMLQVDQPYKMWYNYVKPTLGWIVVKPQLVWLSNQRAAHVLHHFSEKQVHCLVNMRVKNARLQQTSLPLQV